MKIKVLKEYGMDVGYEAYIIGFVRSDGKTLAVIAYEDGTLSENDIKSVEVDFNALKKGGSI